MRDIKKPGVPESEESLYKRICDLVHAARQHMARGVDLVQVYTNFEIGRYIVEHEQRGESRAVYGEELLTILAARLSEEFGKGFSRTNIAHMRSFYLAYRDRGQIIQTASGQSSGLSLGWSHYVFLLGIKNPEERSLYERLALSRNKDGIRQLARDGQIVNRSKDLFDV